MEQIIESKFFLDWEIKMINELDNKDGKITAIGSYAEHFAEKEINHDVIVTTKLANILIKYENSIASKIVFYIIKNIRYLSNNIKLNSDLLLMKDISFTKAINYLEENNILYKYKDDIYVVNHNYILKGDPFNFLVTYNYIHVYGK